MVGLSSIDGFRTRVKFFDYGVVSLALTKPFAGSWQELVEVSQQYIENDVLELRAEEAARQVLGRCAETMTRPHEKYLSEDYLALVVTGLATPVSAEQLVADRGRSSRCSSGASVSRSAGRKKTKCFATACRISPTTW